MTKKLFMDNSYLKVIEANVVEKKYLNNSYHLKLDRTIFYPHLVGGQPRDVGKINDLEVLDVYEEANSKDIWHIVREDIDTSKVKVEINWDVRFDMMQQHSGQHLLSSCFSRLMDCDTLSFHISKDYVYIDIDKEEISAEEINRVEYLANKIIYSNFTVKTYLIDESSIRKLPLRNQPKIQDDIRIVEIDDIDFSPCGGTHVGHTGEIGLVKIRRWYKSKGVTRVEFVCGGRALMDYRRKNKYIQELTSLLSAKDKDVVYKTKSLYYKKEDLEKENKDLRNELNQYKGNYYLQESKEINKIKYLIKVMDNVDLKEINSIAHHLNKKQDLIQIYGIRNENFAQFLISRSHDLDIDLRDIFNIAMKDIDIKGGGSSQLIQGASTIEELENIIDMFSKEIQGYFEN